MCFGQVDTQAADVPVAGGFQGLEVFVPGRICLFGEHSDWSGGYRRFNSEIKEGCALVCGTSQGLTAVCRKIPDRRVLIFRSPDGGSCELALDDMAHLREVAKSPSYYAYIAGSVIELGKHFRVGGAEINNYKSDLPIRKGLSSSAAICVMVVRALNQLYDLKLTVHGEMDIAYRGELNTPSRCGRLDQCVAFGQTVTKMEFDSDALDTSPVRVAATMYLVIVDLCARKDTKEILKCLSEAYPFPRTEPHKSLHELLGQINLDVCAEAGAIISREQNSLNLAQKLGALMTVAQARWDERAVPLCPHELTAPVLHKLLSHEPLKPYITGAKGVGSQGDGTAQLMCTSEEAQSEVMKLVTELGMEPLRLTIPASKSVRTAVVPIAGFCAGMWPATKCAGPWLFPICMNDQVKPAICWLVEELITAGIESIIMVVNEATETSMHHLFKRREDATNLNSVPARIASYDDQLLAIGNRLVFVRQDRPGGIRDAVLACEPFIGSEPFVLAWGDHLCKSTAPDGKGCVAQLMSGFDGSRSVAAMHLISRDLVNTAGIFACKQALMPLPPPLGPRDLPGDAVGSRNWPLSRVAEKPTMVFADEHMVTPGLPHNMFLSSFGQYVLSPAIFSILKNLPTRHFIESVDMLRQQEGLDGIVIEGRRWDLGNVRTYVECLQEQAQASMGESARKKHRAV